MKHKTTTIAFSLLASALLLANGTTQAALSSIATETSTISQVTDYAATPALPHDARDPNISSDGSKIVFISTADLTGQGTNPDNLETLFVMNTDGTGLSQLTHVTINTTYPSDYNINYFIRKPQLSADGSVVVFSSTNNLLFSEDGSPLNPPGETTETYPDTPDLTYMTSFNQIFVMNTDGTGLKQLTNGQGNSISPTISHAGDIVVFQSNADLIGENSDRNEEIYVIKTDGSRLSQITAGTGTKRHDSRDPDISGDGSTVAFDSYIDLIPPLNKDLSDEIFVFDLAGFWRDGAATADHSNYTVQITNSDIAHPDHSIEENAFEATLSYDGTWVAFAACINPDGEGIYKEDRTILGTNPYLPDVLYIAKRDGTELRQLTFSDDPNAYADEDSIWTQNDDDIQRPQISDDGRRIVFASRSRVDIVNDDNHFEIAMIDLDAPGGPDGRPDVEQLTFNTLHTGPYVLQLSFENTDGRKFDPKMSGNAGKILFRADSDFTGGNPDHNKEIFMIEPNYIRSEELTFNVNAATDDTSTNNDDSKSEDLNSSADNSGGGAGFGFIEIVIALLAFGSLRLRRRQ